MKFATNVATIAVAVALLTACAPATKEDPAVASMRAAAEANSQMRDALATVIAAWDTGETDSLKAIMSPNIQRTAPDQSVSNFDDYVAYIAEAHRVYPDFRITNDGMAVGPDGAFVQWTVTGTDSGGANPTGNSLKTSGITRYQFEGGKIVRELVMFDTGAVLAQLQRADLPREGE